MKWQWLIVAVGGLLIAADAPKNDARKDLDRMRGTWVATSAEASGTPFDEARIKAMKMVIKGNKYTYTSVDDYREQGTLTLDPTKKPKTVDIVITEGSDQGETQRGIYQLDKDTLKFCFA